MDTFRGFGCFWSFDKSPGLHLLILLDFFRTYVVLGCGVCIVPRMVSDDGVLSVCQCLFSVG